MSCHMLGWQLTYKDSDMEEKTSEQQFADVWNRELLSRRPPDSTSVAFLLSLCDHHLDGYRVERSSSKTSRVDRRVSNAKHVPVLDGRGAVLSDGDFRARTGNSPWIRGDSMEDVLTRLLVRRFGQSWLDSMRLVAPLDIME